MRRRKSIGLVAPRLSRRSFLKYTGGTALTLYAVSRFGIREAIAQIPGGTLSPGDVEQFVTPLLIPPAMPRAGKIRVQAGKNIDYYEIAMRQFRQQILPAGKPMTTVWGYGPARAQGGPVIFNAPSLTIEAKFDTPVRIKWINELVDASGNFLQHLLKVDPTLHWANPPGGTMHRDSRSNFASMPPAYDGPVPIVTHVHGAVGVGDESDGYAEAWFLPAAKDIPAGYAHEGTWYDFFAAKALARFGEEWGPGFAVAQYPNLGRAAADWYHDHTLGMTRLNVYAGPAGFYIIRGGPQDAVLDSRSGRPATLPGPAPAIGDLPGVTYYEIPLAIQDRSFNSDGSLFYPDTREFFDEIAGPYVPQTDLSPYWNPEFFGNMMMVNGNTWPFQVVEQRRYRFRVLNGCNSRFLILDFSAIPGVSVWQIGNEGGFLAAPVDLTASNGNRLLMAPAERADLIVDFSGVAAGSYNLQNLGPDEPFGGGEPGEEFDSADPETTGRVMQFRVVPATSRDATTPPQFLQLPALAPLPAVTRTRRLALIEQMSMYFEDAPAAALLGMLEGNPNHAPADWVPLEWAETVTENPGVGDTEIWEIYNATADAHPIHIHEVKFELVDRQEIAVDEITHRVKVDNDDTPRTPEPWETGLKDTVIAYPEQVTRVKAHFANGGQFVWHCHIVEHEDNEMMRPYRIGPKQAGEPESATHGEGHM